MRTPNHAHRLRTLTVALLAAAAEAFAEEHLGGTARRRVVVSIPHRKLALMEEGRVLKVYPVAVGAPASPTPAGSFEIVTRIPHPTWYGPHGVVPPSKTNPLGTRWLGLSRRSYGIHGTNNPASIGRRASHGCVRMRNTDVEELFEMVTVGDAVELHDQPSPELAALFAPQPVAAPAEGGQ